MIRWFVGSGVRLQGGWEWPDTQMITCKFPDEKLITWVGASRAPGEKPRGEWNEARIVSKGRHVEHWLNGVRVLEYERGSAAFREAFKATKWNKPEFQKDGPWGEAPEGRILLQDHSDKVSFRNIRINKLHDSGRK